MTAETDLLPLPEPAFRLKWRDGAYYYVSEPNIGSTDCYTAEQVRACVSSATEALRAEVAEARDGWHMANGTAELAMKHRDAAEARAERLAEALRLIESAKDRGFGIDYARGVAQSVLLREQEEGR